MLFGQIALFLLLYAISLSLPSWVEYSVADSREISSMSELAAELKQGSYCKRLGDERLRLPSDHLAATAGGTRLSSLSTGTIACTSRGDRRGWQVLLEGWGGPLIGIFAWYANVLVFASMLLEVIGRAPRTATALALGAVVLGFDAFRFHGDPSVGMTPGPFLDHFESGYYVWEFSLVTWLLFTFVNLFFYGSRQCRRRVVDA
jgi:hypothetical protein